MDMQSCREWYQRHVRGTEEDFQKAVEVARQKIITELRSPDFQAEIWEVAKEFEWEVFGRR
jgi:hypothetical protein